MVGGLRPNKARLARIGQMQSQWLMEVWRCSCRWDVWQLNKAAVAARKFSLLKFQVGCPCADYFRQVFWVTKYKIDITWSGCLTM